jgi:CRISPR/Cas system-associated exonuclease Cas4 (RecB family)
MPEIQDPRTQTIRAISAWREAQEAKQPPRQYLGASIIGHHCERYLWLGFRLAGREQFDGRMLRLFDRGQREEAVFVSELRAIGCEVHDVNPDGSQFAVSNLGGHFRGHMDGAVLGIPESPATWHVLEFKTHSSKSFKELEAKGVVATKPMHYAQMQVYMGLAGMTRALYLAVNKDTDALYQERIEYNAEHFKSLMQRAERVIYSPEAPAPVSHDPSWYQCKFCHFHAQCHGTAAPAVNCRTCAHSTPERDGTWSCDHHKMPNIAFENQLEGCDSHRHFPQLLANWAEVIDANADTNWIQYRNKLSGHTFANCEGGATDYSSAEITSTEDKASIGQLVLTAADMPIQECEVPF